MKIEFAKAHAALSFVGQKQPSITGVTRLETQTTAINLRSGLQAPVADPLWMMARQWQFNEFEGEDAGTPLDLSFVVEGRAVDAFRAGSDVNGAWTSLADGVPIETRVEAEPAWKVHPRLVAEAGLQALRMVGPASRAGLKAAYPFALAAPTDPEVDTAGLLWSALLDGRTVDALALAADLCLLMAADGTLTGLPAALAGDPDPVGTQAALGRWVAWTGTVVHEGDANNPSWRRDRMEYAFALKSGDVALDAAEYTDGHVDWDDFRATAFPNGGQAVTGSFAVASRLPSPVRYPGMPAERYWEFEDGQVSFAGAEAGITDLVRMSVTEFALTFGNDWFVTPVRLPVGGLYRVTQFAITDSFGIVAQAGPIANPGGAAWTLYGMTADANLQGRLGHTLFIPDSVDGIHEGAILEETLLVRDEMANLAWAIEQRVQGVSGEPLDRAAEAKRLAFQQRIQFDRDPASPQLVYRLQTPVPAHWTPLLPVRDPLNLSDPLAIRLARAGMKRFYPEASIAVIGVADPEYEDFLATLDAQVDFIDRLDLGDGLRAYVFHPRGHLLRRDPTQPMPPDDTLSIAEEEVPRIGATLRRKFQFARSSDGRSWLWIGRSKTAGRGEASSALRHDVAVRKDTLR